jgi:hypothetical protein
MIYKLKNCFVLVCIGGVLGSANISPFHSWQFWIVILLADINGEMVKPKDPNVFP